MTTRIVLLAVAFIAIASLIDLCRPAYSSERFYIVRTNPIGAVSHCWVSNELFNRSPSEGGLFFIADRNLWVRADIITTDAASLGIDPAKCVNGRYGFQP